MKIAFIGCGNMATSMLAGLLDSGMAKPEDINATCRSKPSKYFADKGIKIVSNQEAVDFADIVFLATKPQQYDEVIDGLARTKGKVFVTVAPGVTTDYVAALTDGLVIRTMPNTPAFLGEGATSICRGKNVPDEIYDFVLKICKSFGSVYELEEWQMDASVALSGSSPAYAFMMIEALSKHFVNEGMKEAYAITTSANVIKSAAQMVLSTGKTPRALLGSIYFKEPYETLTTVLLPQNGVACGLMLINEMSKFGARKRIDSNEAIKIAAQVLKGSAQMVLQTGESPEDLRIKVCSPGGTTIEAVKKFQELGFEDVIIEAMKVGNSNPCKTIDHLQKVCIVSPAMDACTIRACELSKDETAAKNRINMKKASSLAE